jgi:hypothetical protein
MIINYFENYFFIYKCRELLYEIDNYAYQADPLGMSENGAIKRKRRNRDK